MFKTPKRPTKERVEVVKIQSRPLHMRYFLIFVIILVYFHPWATWKWRAPEGWELQYWWTITAQTFTME